VNAVRLTRDLIARSRVIAKGQRIRDLRRLLEMYGGQPSQWVKKSSPMFNIEGDDHEFHWYEHHGIGRFEIKLKRLPK
jgi:hypothetical protein